MSRSQKVNEPETMSTASAYLYKEQAECVQQVHQYLVEHLDSRVTQAELAQRYHISLTSLKGASNRCTACQSILTCAAAVCSMRNSCFSQRI